MNDWDAHVYPDSLSGDFRRGSSRQQSKQPTPHRRRFISTVLETTQKKILFRALNIIWRSKARCEPHWATPTCSQSRLGTRNSNCLTSMWKKPFSSAGSNNQIPSGKRQREYGMGATFNEYDSVECDFPSSGLQRTVQHIFRFN